MYLDAIQAIKALGLWDDNAAGKRPEQALFDIIEELQCEGLNYIKEVSSNGLAFTLLSLARSGYEVTPDVTARSCACGCGQPVISPRPEARYATGACRVRAHRNR